VSGARARWPAPQERGNTVLRQAKLSEAINQNQTMKSIIILYHANCLDGFTAAWAAWKKLKSKADYYAVKHQAPPPKGLENKTIYLVDFSYAPHTDVLKKLIKNNKSVTVLDHHITAKEHLQKLSAPDIDNFKFIFDNAHSGAHLSWKYFHPKEKIPQLVKYVEDTDLWKFKLGNTAIIPFIEAHELEFKTWDKLEKLLEDPKTRKECAEKGKLILAYQKKVIKSITSSATEVTFEGHKTLAANCPILRSEIGHELVQKKPPFSIIWREKGGQIVVSLRGDGTINCAKIAESYGGGGHKNAAGFVLQKGQKIPWK
jgi:uncharacterized protein